MLGLAARHTQLGTVGMYAASHPSTVLRKAQVSDPWKKGSKRDLSDWHSLLPMGRFQAAAQQAGTQPEPGNCAVVKRQQQEFGATEVPSIYKRGGSCVERAGELQNLSLWLNSDLCRMQDREKNGQEACHYATLRARTGEALFPTRRGGVISEKDGILGRVLEKPCRSSGAKLA